jgi:hypothetical protein
MHDTERGSSSTACAQAYVCVISSNISCQDSHDRRQQPRIEKCVIMMMLMIVVVVVSGSTIIMYDRSLCVSTAWLGRQLYSVH